MDSFLITGATKQLRKNRADEFRGSSISQENYISQFDVIYLEDESLGINEVRKLTHDISLKPALSEKKLVIISDAQTLTIEAQNALLKTLEEPPLNTIIILTSPNTELLLPTIVSRCELIELATNNQQLTTEELEVGSQQLEVLLKGGVGERLKLAQDVTKTREDAIFWLEKMIVATRQILISSKVLETHEIDDLRKLLKGLQKAHTILKTTNVNARLTLESLFINL